MKQPIEYRCPKCGEPPGYSCRDMRYISPLDEERKLVSLVFFHGLMNPHKERVLKARVEGVAKEGEWSDPSMMQNAISKRRRGEW